ncbi:MAG: hypothetical protein ACO3N3_14265, partial [bacterium]
KLHLGMRVPLVRSAGSLCTSDDSLSLLKIFSSFRLILPNIRAVSKRLHDSPKPSEILFLQERQFG